jgi:5-methylcytosine-specific restriction endonuclease McrA
MTSITLPLTSGTTPPHSDTGIPKSFDNIDDILLYAAWMHGLTTNNEVHRLEIFSFIWSHVTNKPDETLQGVIERSDYWVKNINEKGFYRLSKLGLEQMKKRYNLNCTPLEFGLEYSFFYRFREREFQVTVDVKSRELLPHIDGSSMEGTRVVERLQSLGANIPKTQSSAPKRVINWILRSEDYYWTAKYPHPPINQSIPSPTSKDNNDETLYLEGKEILRLHRTKERKKEVVKLAKDRAMKDDPLLRCEVCGFSFFEVYGEVGTGFIEAHHTVPLSELSEQTETRVEDLALVCSNCHRILHKRKPLQTVKELRSMLKATWKDESDPDNL